MFSHRRRSTEDFSEEIQAHIALETARLIDDGMNPEDARTAAIRRFGNITRAQERFYEAGRILWLDRLWQDLRCALRSMAKHPLASGVAVVSLAVGIGSTTAMLTLRDAVFFKPPPLYQNPEQLCTAQISTTEVGRGRVPGALYKLWSSGAAEAPERSMSPPLYLQNS
jgi:putative ABC transport system permease protein